MKIKHFLLVLVWRIWFGFKGYYLWSKFWRWVFEPRHQKMPVTSFRDIAELGQVLQGWKWGEDPVKGMMDIISSPQHVEWRWQESILQQKDPEVGDCDEFAVYSAHVLSKLPHLYTKVGVMSVSWWRPSGSFAGHNICVFWNRTTESYYHTGNWGTRPLMRDGEKMITLDDVAKSVYNEGTLIGWAVGDPELNSVVALRAGWWTWIKRSLTLIKDEPPSGPRRAFPNHQSSYRGRHVPCGRVIEAPFPLSPL